MRNSNDQRAKFDEVLVHYPMTYLVRDRLMPRVSIIIHSWSDFIKRKELGKKIQ